MRSLLRKPFRFVRDLFRFVLEIIEKRYLIYELVKRDFKSKYSGSFLGLLWSFLQPVLMMLIMWFVLTQGMKVGKVGADVPYVVYLFVGQVIWTLFSDAWAGSTGVIIEYSFLVKKVNFRLSILPIVKILSAFINHVIFLLFVVIILLVNGIKPTIYWIQFFYYFMYVSTLCLGLSWITSAINVFLKDIGYIIGILLTFGFWLSPIFWDIRLMPEAVRPYIQLNPMVYAIEGYRNSFIYKTAFWEVDIIHTAYSWMIAILFLFVGMIVFKRLRPHFADVI